MATLRDALLRNNNLEFFKKQHDEFSFGITEQVLIDKFLDMSLEVYMVVCGMLQCDDSDDIVENAMKIPRAYSIINVFAAYGITKIMEKICEGEENVN